MKVLALTHGPSVGPGVFEDAVRAAGHELVEWQVPVDGVPTVPRSWEDTVNVAGKRRVTIAFRPDDRPGRWMYHCHILEHHAAGMMGHFEVVR